MRVVVISGGIGSGKSTVCRILKEDYGWPVYEADVRVKDLYRSHPTLLGELEAVLSESFRGEDGDFMPARLAARIFSDQQALLLVEKIVFPILTEDFLEWKASHAGCEFVILESATILEKPDLLKMADKIAVVDARLETRINRAMLRDGLVHEQVMKRVENQKLMNSISEGYIPSCVDYVINNDGTEKELVIKVKDFVDNMTRTKML